MALGAEETLMWSTAQEELVNRLRECEGCGLGAYLSAAEIRVVLACVELSTPDDDTTRSANGDSSQIDSQAVHAGEYR
ncbi:MAG: hypothetical protein OXU81_23715 [Gammaproteobacteria bacterium]|nr:hypothetical protein [Gammaproteobacteria bacterium]